MNERPYRIAFSLTPGIGPVRFRLLVERFGSAEHAWTAPESDVRSSGLPPRLAEDFLRFRQTFSPSSYEKRLADAGVRAVSPEDESYPVHLRSITDAPIVLFVKGSVPVDYSRAVAVVGTRRMTAYGQDMTRKIVAGLAAEGIPVVSGMAYGVDAVAHTTAIASGGKTVAVLGCGVDIPAPEGNYSIYRAIVNGAGTVISEMPLGQRPEKGVFVTRNRIISGMSLGVVVIEAPEKSGALITARYAADQGRDVFAVPGAVTNPSSRGTFLLLADGATPVSGASDVLSALRLPAGSQKEADAPANNPTATRIYSLLTERGPTGINDIARAVGLTETDAAATLTVLEMDGWVRDTGWKVYAANTR